MTVLTWLVALHTVGIVICVISIAFPNILKRPQKYHRDLVATTPHREVEIQSRGGYPIHAWFFDNVITSKVVLLVHGRSRAKDYEMPYVKAFLSDFSVMAIDLKGHGENAYATTSIGYHEAGDILGALDWLAKEGVSEVGILGHSMGGAAAIKAAASGMPEGLAVKALVTEGTFADLDELLRGRAKAFFIPPTVYLPAFEISELVAGYRFRDNAPERFVQHVACPILILNADRDGPTPPDSGRRIHGNAAGPKRMRSFRGIHDTPSPEVSSLALEFFREHL